MFQREPRLFARRTKGTLPKFDARSAVMRCLGEDVGTEEGVHDARPRF